MQQILQRPPEADLHSFNQIDRECPSSEGRAKRGHAKVLDFGLGLASAQHTGYSIRTRQTRGPLCPPTIQIPKPSKPRAASPAPDLQV